VVYRTLDRQYSYQRVKIEQDLLEPDSDDESQCEPEVMCLISSRICDRPEREVNFRQFPAQEGDFVLELRLLLTIRSDKVEVDEAGPLPSKYSGREQLSKQQALLVLAPPLYADRSLRRLPCHRSNIYLSDREEHFSFFFLI